MNKLIILASITALFILMITIHVWAEPITDLKTIVHYKGLPTVYAQGTQFIVGDGNIDFRGDKITFVDNLNRTIIISGPYIIIVQ